MIEAGDGEPHPIDQEIVIESHYDAKARYWFYVNLN